MDENNPWGEFALPNDLTRRSDSSPTPTSVPVTPPTTPPPSLPPQALPVYSAPEIPLEGRALLDTIAGTEAHSYNIIYGGQRFTSYADHPRVAVPIASGPNAGKTSSAAGRYQFLGSTWDTQKAKLGLKDFSPRSQDIAAWDLAQSTYKDKTGRELLADLKAGKLDEVGAALHEQWTSLPGGIEQGTSGNDFKTRFAKAIQQGPNTPPVTPDALFGDDKLMHGYQAAATSKDYTFTDALSAAARHETALGLIYWEARSAFVQGGWFHVDARTPAREARRS